MTDPLTSDERNDNLFDLLLMEDDDNLRHDIAKNIKLDFPGASVHEAATVDEALDKLDALQPKFPPGEPAKRRPSIDLAICDIRLPKDRGLAPMAHGDVANRLRELMIPSIFMTGYRDSGDVVEFCRNQNLVDPNTVVLEKSNKLIEDLRNQVGELFRRLASRSVSYSFERMFGANPAQARSGTALLMELQAEIGAYWRYLDEDTKSRILQRFTLRELSDGSLHFSLLL